MPIIRRDSKFEVTTDLQLITYIQCLEHSEVRGILILQEICVACRQIHAGG